MSLAHVQVYDVTSFVSSHPGGVAKLMRGAGQECSDMFYYAHQWIPPGCAVGCLVQMLLCLVPAQFASIALLPPTRRRCLSRSRLLFS